MVPLTHEEGVPHVGALRVFEGCSSRASCKKEREREHAQQPGRAASNVGPWQRAMGRQHAFAAVANAWSVCRCLERPPHQPDGVRQQVHKVCALRRHDCRGECYASCCCRHAQRARLREEDRRASCRRERGSEHPAAGCRLLCHALSRFRAPPPQLSPCTTHGQRSPAWIDQQRTQGVFATEGSSMAPCTSPAPAASAAALATTGRRCMLLAGLWRDSEQSQLHMVCSVCCHPCKVVHAHWLICVVSRSLSVAGATLPRAHPHHTHTPAWRRRMHNSEGPRSPCELQGGLRSPVAQTAAGPRHNPSSKHEGNSDARSTVDCW
jgi:hypothetical protein